MTRIQNCWEFKECGREPGGNKVEEFGVCPAAVEASADGINRGKMGGRICWAVSGTYCRGEVQGIFAAKITSCASCAFFQTVDREENNILEQTEKFLAKRDKDKAPKI
ncbi:MAG: two-CW domain-containing protein [Thermodesulfobacteriota bacterium]